MLMRHEQLVDLVVTLEGIAVGRFARVHGWPNLVLVQLSAAEELSHGAEFEVEDLELVIVLYVQEEQVTLDLVVLVRLRRIVINLTHICFFDKTLVRHLDDEVLGLLILRKEVESLRVEAILNVDIPTIRKMLVLGIHYALL